MSDFLKTIGTLNILDKVGEQDHTIDCQGHALDNMNDALRDTKDNISCAKADAEFQCNRANELETLLSRPMAEIAVKNGRFREAYDRQQKMLVDWILSQHTFRELAIKYGRLADRTPEEIQAEGMTTKEIILDDQSQFENTVAETEKANLQRKEARKEKQARAAQNKTTRSA